jgi:hypothetical protein
MKKTMLLAISITAMVLAASGCTTTRYTWGKYDQSLYNYYRNPELSPNYLEDLKDAVDRGESAQTVPPGLYAEYGYALLESGKPDEATVNFNKEKALWPESKVLMEKLARNVSKMKKPAAKEAKTEAVDAAGGAK